MFGVKMRRKAKKEEKLHQFKNIHLYHFDNQHSQDTDEDEYEDEEEAQAHPPSYYLHVS